MECLESVQCYRITNSDFFIEGAPRAMHVLLKLIQTEKKIFKDKCWTKTKVSHDVICPLSLPLPPLCPQRVNLVIVSHRAAQHLFAVRAQRLQWSLTAAPSKIGISFSCPLKSFTHHPACFEHLCSACKLDCGQHKPESKTNNCIWAPRGFWFVFFFLDDFF